MAMFATWWIGMMNFKKSQNESESLEEERRSGGGTLEAAGLRQMTNAFWGLKGRSGETLAMFACTEQNYTGYVTYIGWWIIMESGLWGDQEVWGDSDFREEEDLGGVWTRLEDRSLKIQTSILLLCDWGTWRNMDEIGGWEKRERGVAKFGGACWYENWQMKILCQDKKEWGKSELLLLINHLLWRKAWSGGGALR